MEDKEKLNIVIFSWRGLNHPNAGGAEVSTHEHAKGWVKAGHSVTLFTSFYRGAKAEEVIDGVTIIRKGRQFFGVQWEAFKWYLFGKHPKIDLVVDQFHGIPFFTPLYVRSKILAFIHEVSKEVWAYNPWIMPFHLVPQLLGPIIEPLIFKVFYKGVKFMTVSESTRKDLIHWGIPKRMIEVVHNGLDRQKREASLGNRINSVMFLGALAKDKGIEDALEAFAILNRQNFGLDFWVAGKGDSTYTEFLKSKAVQLGLQGRIKFFGYVSEEEKFRMLSQTKLLINTSIREGWGLVVIEAASMGTPTVGYDVPGLRDSIIDKKTGLLSETSSDSLAEKISYLLVKKKIYQKFQIECLKWSARFSWDKAAAESLSLINSIVSD